jgi:uncharacterized protein (DUF952 family)
MIYKILRPAEFAALTAGTFAGAPIDIADGFVHLSTAAQVEETLLKHFAGEPDLILVAINPTPLGPALRWEPSRGGALFPHLYARLTLAMVTAHADVSWVDGRLILP